MAHTLELLQKEYDYILIDAPPVMSMSDAVLLSPLVEGVVLVVGGQSTPKSIVRDACARLEYAQAKLLGVVLNKVKWQSVDYAYYSDNSPYYAQTEQGSGFRV
jgi:Mrp family chromosome partitioning ATPase